jgi:hypothetical protein
MNKWNIDYRKFNITQRKYEEYQGQSMNQLRVIHKTIEKKDNIIYIENKIPKVREDYRCSTDKKLTENIILKDNFSTLLNTRASYQIKLRNKNFATYKLDKGHKYLLNAYYNKGKKCDKIITEQQKLLKPKKKKRKRYKKKQKHHDCDMEADKQKLIEDMSKLKI